MHQNMTHANLWHIGFTMTPCVCLFPKSSSFNCILSRVSDFRPSKMWVVWISVYFSQFLLKSIPLNDQNCHTNCIEEKLGLLRNCRGAPWLIGNIKRQAAGKSAFWRNPQHRGHLTPPTPWQRTLSCAKMPSVSISVSSLAQEVDFP